jgi:endogenous inhibitor of DNA gyrase (YacG/DUF329 family)
LAVFTCPVCQRKVEVENAPSAPFCSERCRVVDLGRWLKEQYAVPHEAADEEAADLDLVPE